MQSLGPHDVQDADTIRQVRAEHPEMPLAAYSIAGFMLMKSDSPGAENLLQEAFETGLDTAEDNFVSTYMTTFIGFTLNCHAG